MTQVAMRRVTLLGVCSVLMLALSGLAVRAADTAKIEGVLKESSGAVLADARVTLKPPSGADKRTTSDAKGAFTFSGLAAGTYSITIESSGFQTTRYTKLELKEGQTRQFDFSLRPGAVSEAFEVDITRPLSAADIDRMFNPNTPPPAPGTASGRGVIAGLLLRGTGDAAQAVRVGVVPADSSTYGVPRTMAYDTRTDSVGFYRLELPPGRYFVVAGSESYLPDTSYLDRPVYFPGVPDASRAMAIAVTANSYDTADFRLEPVSPPVVILPSPPIYYYSPYRVSGQVIMAPRIIVPQPYPYPYTSGPIYVPDYLPSGLQVILQSGGPARGCGPARTSYSASVGWDGQFDFRSVSPGVYDVCVIQTGVVIYGGPGGPGGASSRGGAPRTLLYGPSTVVVDRDIANLRLDIGAVAIYR